MPIFKSKLDILLRIYNIPLEENWPEWSMSDGYTVYKYWYGLGLFSNSEFEDIFTLRKVTLNKVFIRFFKNLDYHYNPENYRDGFVADVGSGFGFITFWLILSGAKKIYTIGDPKRIGFIQKLYTRVTELGIIEEGRIFFKGEFIKVGDVSLSEDITNNSLSLVLLHDTLEHISPRIFPYLVKSAYNNLKAGGFFIAITHSTDSPSMLKKLKLFWDKIENSSYINQRIRFIRERKTRIDEGDIQKLARNSRGMDSIDFFAALDLYDREKKIPNSKLDLPPIDVEMDVPAEGDTSIVRILSEFESNNFQSIKVYPEMMGSYRSRYLQPLSKKCASFFLRLHIFDESIVFSIRK